MSRRHSSVIVAVPLATLLAMAGCTKSPFDGITDAISGDITQGDTTLLTGESTLLAVVVVYNFGRGAPRSMGWGVSDTSKLDLTVLPDLTAQVIARDTGEATVYGYINELFHDSLHVTVVNHGDVRWRRSLTASPALYAAVDDSGRVYATTADNQVVVVAADGAPVRAVALCAGALGPSVSGGGVTSTGQDCAQRITRAGGPAWTQAFGQPESGAALAADDASLIVSAEGAGGTAAVVLSRISPLGAILWRDTLVAAPQPTGAGLAIGSDGGIYVPWRTATDSSRLTRFTTTGTLSWTLELPGRVRLASPAVSGTRVVVTYDGGVFVALTAGTGTPLWSRAFSDASAVFSAAEAASSPMVDAAGNIYIQTPDGLISYGSTGTVRWVADSLGGGDGTLGVGAPTLLGANTVVVPCGGDVCGVASGSGARLWRVTLGGVIGGVNVGLDGTLIVLRRVGAGGELVGLWNRVGMAASGWPTEGSDAARSRRQH